MIGNLSLAFLMLVFFATPSPSTLPRGFRPPSPIETKSTSKPTTEPWLYWLPSFSDTVVMDSILTDTLGVSK
jgi:hypothetical protein